ncbi:adenylylsulfatase HINT1-like isoform X4 [Gossypium arboreum]|uniref:adenylylsulfatase HINT1-like isoform X4 n=1 Tax=Gossypium arboreum TaxID=29729 RepID=UPI0022F15031|nr:adenylylsulfatase HINT1-like isoform X4 [Gossypium arboreum]
MNDEIKKSRLFVLSSHLTCLPPASSLMASEKEAALASAPSDSPTIFDKIINKEIPATVVYEDDKLFCNRRPKELKDTLYCDFLCRFCFWDFLIPLLHQPNYNPKI